VAPSVEDGIMMPMPPRNVGQLPGNVEARVREREAARSEGATLFGRKGILREISEMQMPMPMPTRIESSTGGLLQSEIRAEERRMAKEARVQALLEEREHHERMSDERRGLQRRLSTVPSAPVLPGLGSTLGMVAQSMSMPEDMEKQKLRLACKIETLSFLNGYHNAVGKMSMEQKASLLAKLHSTKTTKPRSGRCAEVKQDTGWTWTEATEEDQCGVQQRLQHVNDSCNEAFDFEAEL
jgi:hypothetical protein